MRDKILDSIRTNRISTVEVADALGKTGVLPEIYALNAGKYIAGEVFYTCAWSESNWSLHEQIQEVPEGKIVYVDSIHCGKRAIFGDLVAKWLILYRKASGVVVNGYVRDIHRLKKEGYPIWCTGTTPLGCFNRDVPLTEEVSEYINSQRKIFEGAILIADDSGCTLIESQKQTPNLLERINFIELQEDIWYFCTDTLKLSTYETICKKKYLEDPSLLPLALKSSLDSYED